MGFVVLLDFFGKKQGNVFSLDKRVMQRAYFLPNGHWGPSNLLEMASLKMC
jgi:hypothetical protein